MLRSWVIPATGVAFSASSLARLNGRERWQFLLEARRRVGLAFALSHTIHLAAIVTMVIVVYVGGALQKGYAYYWLYSALCLALLGLRISAFWNKRRAAYA